MKQAKYLMRGMLSIGLGAMIQPAVAQLNCGAGAAPGAQTHCTTDGLGAQLWNNISIFAPESGLTSFTTTQGQATTAGSSSLMTGSGSGDIDVVIEKYLTRSLDFSAHTGDLRLQVRSAPMDAGSPGGFVFGGGTFSSGNIRMEVDENAVVSFKNLPILGATDAVSLDFGAGNSEIVNRGYFLVGNASVVEIEIPYDQGTGLPNARSLSLLNLDRFENHADLVLGGLVTAGSFRPGIEVVGRGLPITDLTTSTVLSMPGTHFIGAGGSALHMDAVFTYGTAQVNCQDRVKRHVAPDIPPGSYSWSNVPRLMAADCVDLRGGQTSGVTEVVIYDEQPGNLSASFGDGEILLIDVQGGESAAGHFVLSPRSQHYDVDTGALQQGFVMFPLVYDADNQQHKLVSLPGERALALPHLMQAVQAVARNVGRDAVGALGGADDPDRSSDSGTWVKLSSRTQSRDVRHSFSRYGTHVGVDSSHDTNTTALTMGRSWQAGDWAVGGAISYVDAGVDFDYNDLQADLAGASVALLARYQGERLFVSNLAQLQWLEMDVADPSLQLVSLGNKSVGYVKIDPSNTYRQQVGDAGTQTLHLRSEVGWRLSFGETFIIEPLLGASWLRSEIDTVTIQSYERSAGNNRFFGDHADSLRATLGGRAAFSQPGERLNLRVTAGLRYWQSLKDETDVTITNAGPDLVVQDDFDGGWTELNAGLELASPDGRIAGQLEAQAMVGDYEGYGVTAGMRFQW
jgi:hypothetical protein